MRMRIFIKVYNYRSILLNIMQECLVYRNVVQ